MTKVKKDTLSKKQGRPIRVFPDKCTGCLICELRCALRFERSILLSASAIKVRRTGDDTYNITFTGNCDRCGICANNCMYGALVPEEG